MNKNSLLFFDGHVKISKDLPREGDPNWLQALEGAIPFDTMVDNNRTSNQWW
jgi:prepilin-type processing-associated H-X9-DG protein